jgi:integrase
MDHTPPTCPSRGKATKVATGIAVRQWQHSTTIRISFWYKGVECRETLSLPANKSNLHYAERLRGEILNAIERGIFDYAQYFPDSKRARIFGHVNANPLIGDLLTQFLEQAQRALQPSTVTGYRRVSQAHLFPTFGRIPIKELTPALIRPWISELNLTTKAIRNILTPLRAVLNQAVNDDLILKSPLDRVVLHKLLDKNTCQSDYVPDPFNRQEIQALIEVAEGQIKNLIQFAFFTGLRPSELIALEWNDIDWVNGLAHICRAVVEKQEKTTKTHAGQRDVLLLPPALEALQAQKPYTFLYSQRVFHNPLHHKPWICDAHIRKPHWMRLFRLSGVRYRNPYQTRHTYASMLLSAGENMLWAAKQMGHRDTEMIIKTYGKWIPNTDSKSGYQPIHNWEQALSFPSADL